MFSRSLAKQYRIDATPVNNLSWDSVPILTGQNYLHDLERCSIEKLGELLRDGGRLPLAKGYRMNVKVTRDPAIMPPTSQQSRCMPSMPSAAMMVEAHHPEFVANPTLPCI